MNNEIPQAPLDASLNKNRPLTLPPPKEYTSKMCHVRTANNEGFIRTSDDDVYYTGSSGGHVKLIHDAESGKILPARRYKLNKKQRRKVRAERRRNLQETEENSKARGCRCADCGAQFSSDAALIAHKQGCSATRERIEKDRSHV